MPLLRTRVAGEQHQLLAVQEVHELALAGDVVEARVGGGYRLQAEGQIVAGDVRQLLRLLEPRVRSVLRLACADEAAGRMPNRRTNASASRSVRGTSAARRRAARRPVLAGHDVGHRVAFRRRARVEQALQIERPRRLSERPPDLGRAGVRVVTVAPRQLRRRLERQEAPKSP